MADVRKHRIVPVAKRGGYQPTAHGPAPTTPPPKPSTLGAFVPDYSKEESVIEVEVRPIIVYALRENKRPVGFAPWPKSKKKHRKKGGKRA